MPRETQNRKVRAWRSEQARARFVVVVFGLAGVTFGYLGYRTVYATRSRLDAFYAALQLLVLNGTMPSEPIETPWTLHVGRLLSLVGTLSTLVLIALRLSITTTSRLSARQAKHHRVVFGTTPEACRLALSAVESAQASGRIRVGAGCEVVLVGEFDHRQSMDLRSRGVVVVGAHDDKVLADAIRGARSIVIAESNDLVGLDLMRRVLDRGDARRSRLHVVLRSTALAATIRSLEPADGGLPAGVSVVSLPQAAALRLTQFDMHPTRFTDGVAHLVVAGRGDLAAELAVASALSNLNLPTWSPQVRLTLISGPADTWPAMAHEQLPGADANSCVAAGTSGSEIAACIVEACKEVRVPSQVFIAGLDDTDAIVAATRVRQSLAQATVTAVLEQNLDASALKDAAVHWITLGDLIEDPWLLLTGTAERLGAALRHERDERRKFTDSRVLDRMLPGDASEQGTALGEYVLTEVRRAGLEPVARSVVSRVRRLEPWARLSITHGMLSRYPTPSDEDPAGYELRVAELVHDLPRVFAGLGLDLSSNPYLPSNQSGTETVTDEMIERMAEAIHEHYRETMGSLPEDVTGSPRARASWSQLSEDDREANRRQARDVVMKVEALGYVIVPQDDHRAMPFVMTGKMVEALARWEHERWAQQKIKGGWVFGESRDDARRIHHLLVEYDCLTEDQKDLDREAVLFIPNLLTSAGVGVVRLNV
jgi:hypothetical protein